MRGYECIDDYYDNYLFGRTPQDVARARERETLSRERSQERLRREMEDYRERYGD